MSLDPAIRARLTLPVICAPMFLVTGPDLVREACKAGVIGGVPRANARSLEEFEGWLKAVRGALDAHEGPTAPIAVNLAIRMPADELNANLDACARHGVEIIISVAGNPADMVARAHDRGMKVFHDVTSVRFAEKAIAAKVDGLTCIGAGGGGHSGTVSHLALIPQIRAMFDGTIVLAGAVSTGAVVRAAEILGADLAYMGTRFIATRESAAADAYKALLVSQTSADLMFTDKIAGVAANWMTESMRQNGLDPLNLPQPLGPGMRHDHLPDGVHPWKTLWSAGQGIDLIHDLPLVADLVLRLRAEYVAACAAPDMADAARLADAALDAAVV
jgi:nitronate monooxygenase